jgi:hypothetical protein
MFKARQWPEGFEFPACTSCNGGSSREDLLIAWLARIDFTDDENAEQDQEFNRLLSTIRAREPGLIDRMIPTAEEDKALSEKMGIAPLGTTAEPELVPVHVPTKFDNAVHVFSAKLFKGVYYQEIGNPFPENGCILSHWFTNAHLFTHGSYPMFDALSKLAGKAPLLKRQKRLLNDQFEYKVSISEDRSLLLLQARFGRSFGIVSCGSGVQGLLEDHLTKGSSSSKLNTTFSVLQSPSIAITYTDA